MPSCVIGYDHVTNGMYIYFIAEDITSHSIHTMLHRKNALRGMVFNVTKTDTSQPENELDIISCLSKAFGDKDSLKFLALNNYIYLKTEAFFQ